MAHEREGYISTFGLKSDLTVVFLDPDFLYDAGVSAISVILRIFHCACAKRPYFHFRSKIWRHHCVPWPDFLQDARISAIRPKISVILRIFHIFHCACAKRQYFHFLSKIWRHHCVPRPRFPSRRENFGDSAVNKRYIAYFLLRMRETTVFWLPV